MMGANAVWEMGEGVVFFFASLFFFRHLTDDCADWSHSRHLTDDCADWSHSRHLN